MDCQVGAAFAINGQILGVECFGYQGTFGRFFEKLVRSYALDALDWLRDTEGGKASERGARDLLSDLGQLKPKVSSSVGLGENVLMEGENVSGAALIAGGQLLHLSAFRREAGQSDPGSRVGYSRFTQRRGRRSQ